MFTYKAKKNLLNDKVIFITGASKGIGRAAAKSFAAHGATVLIHGRNTQALESLYDEITASGAPEPYIITLDFATATFDDFIFLRDNIATEFNHIDGLLHNASTLGRLSPIVDTLTQDWSKIMQVNVNAAFMLTKAMLPLLQEAPHASVIFTSSSVGRKGRAYWGGYAASKFATEGLMQVLADELENISNIRVNSLNPGATRTDMRRQAYPGELASSNPLPEEKMDLYLYLMGDDSMGTNGQALNAE